jgi:hypothetical protein
MRKIDQETRNAFHFGYDYKNNNTKVIKTEKDIRVFLHNNCIAKKVYGDGIYLNSCGWETVTTKSRLNALLDLKDKIYQKNFVWYWKNGEEFKNGWNKI